MFILLYSVVLWDGRTYLRLAIKKISVYVLLLNIVYYMVSLRNHITSSWTEDLSHRFSLKHGKGRSGKEDLWCCRKEPHSCSVPASMQQKDCASALIVALEQGGIPSEPWTGPLSRVKLSLGRGVNRWWWGNIGKQGSHCFLIISTLSSYK